MNHEIKMSIKIWTQNLKFTKIKSKKSLIVSTYASFPRPELQLSLFYLRFSFAFKASLKRNSLSLKPEMFNLILSTSLDLLHLNLISNELWTILFIGFLFQPLLLFFQGLLEPQDILNHSISSLLRPFRLFWSALLCFCFVVPTKIKLSMMDGHSFGFVELLLIFFPLMLSQTFLFSMKFVNHNDGPRFSELLIIKLHRPIQKKIFFSLRNDAGSFLLGIKKKIMHSLHLLFRVFGPARRKTAKLVLNWSITARRDIFINFHPFLDTLRLATFSRQTFLTLLQSFQEPIFEYLELRLIIDTLAHCLFIRFLMNVTISGSLWRETKH